MLLNLFRTFLGNVGRQSNHRSSGFRSWVPRRIDTRGTLRRFEQLEDRTLLAAQFVTLGATTATAGGNQVITVPVTYQTFDGTGSGTDASNLGTPDDFDVTAAVEFLVQYDSGVFSAPTATTPVSPLALVNNVAGEVRLQAFFFGSSFTPSDTSAELELVELTFTTPASFSAATAITVTVVQPGNIVGGGGVQPDSVVQNLTVNPVSSVSIAGTTDGAEGATPTNGLFTVTQSATSASSTVVNFSVAGTAEDNGVDYSISGTGVTYDPNTNTGTVTIAAGQVSRTISIDVVDGNSLVEDTETVSITLDSIVDDGDNPILGTTNDSIDITDNDSATFSITNATVNEAAGTATFSVSLDNPIDTAFTIDVDYTTGSATAADFDNTQDTVVFNAGDNATKMVTVAITEDSLVEGTQTFTAGLSTPTALGGRTVTLTDIGTGTITDNDTATLSVASTGTFNESSGANNIVVTLTALDQSAGPATLATALTADIVDAMSGTATSGSDYTAVGTQTVTFAAGSANAATRNSTLTLTNDTLVEGDETVNLTLQNLNTTLNGQASLGTTASAVTITDNDTATIAIGAASTITEEGGAQSIAVTLTTSDGAGGTATLATALTADVVDAASGTATSGTDYAALTTQTVTFNAGDGDGTVFNISVAPTNDAFVEGNETVDLTLQNLNTTQDGQSSLGNTSSTVTIDDNDTATISIAASTVVDEEGGTQNVAVTLSTSDGAGGTATLATGVTLTADVVDAGTGSAASGGDYTAVGTRTVTFNPGDGDATVANVGLAITSDTTLEGDETIDLTLQNLNQTLDGQAALGTTAGVVTITDDDTPRVSVTTTTATADEASGTVVFDFFRESGDTVAILNVNFSVSGTTDAAADYTVSGPGVTFNAGLGTGTITLGTGVNLAQLTVTPNNDALVEGNETVAVTVEAGGNYNIDAQSSDSGTIDDNDTATLAVAASATLTEQGGAQGVNVTLTTSDGAGGTATLATGVTLTADVIDALSGTAGSGTDYAALSTQTVTFNAGDGDGTISSVSITPTNDTLVEGNETIGLTLQNLNSTLDGQASLGNSSSTVTIADNDTATISVAAATSVTEEGGSQNVVVTLTTSDGAGGTATLATGLTADVVDAGSGTAASGTDYGALSTQMVTFNAGDGDGTVQNISVAPVNDALVEGNETIGLTLQNLNATLDGQASLGTTSGTVTIDDNDTASISIAANTEVTEEGGAQNVAVTLSTSDGAGGTATLATGITLTADVVDAGSGTADSGTDYDALTTQTVTFNAGDGDATVANVVVTPISDMILEADETIALTLQNLNTTLNGQASLATTAGTATIADNDTPRISLTTSTALADEASGTLVFDFTRVDGDINTPVTVNFAVSGSADLAADFTASGSVVTYNSGDGTGTITLGAGQTTNQLTLTPTNDALVEGNEGVTVTLQTGVNYNVDTQSTDSGTIDDNDTATLSIAALTSVTEEGGAQTVDVTLVTSDGASGTATLAPGITLTADVVDATGGTALSGTDYTALTTQTVTFNPGDGDGTTSTISVTPIADVIVENDETINLTLQNLNSTVDGQASLGTTSGVVSITNNDTASLSIDDVTAAEDGVFTFTINSTLVATEDITVVVDTADGTATLAGSDYTQVSAQTATIMAGSTSTTVTVTVSDDDIVEDDETFDVNLSDARFNGVVNATRVTIGDGTGVGTITNNDAASLSIDDVTTAEDGAFTFTISSDKLASQDMTVVVNTADGTATLAGSDYTQVNAQTATIMAGSMSTSVTVTVNDDAIVEDDETFTVNLTDARFTGATDASRVTIGDAAGLGTITNNDTASLSINDVTASEDGIFTYLISTSRLAMEDLSVLVNSSDGTATLAGLDYTQVFAQRATIFAGSMSTMFMVTVNDDNIVESDETFDLTLSDAQYNGATDATRVTIGDAVGLGTITNNDTASLSIDDVTAAEDGVFTFTINSSLVATEDITVVVNTADGTATGGSDYTQVSAQMATIMAGSTSTTVTVTVSDDMIVEDDETFDVNLSDARFNGATDASRVIIGDGTGVGTITNNDAASLSIDDVTAAEDGTFTFTISSDKVASQDMTVVVNTADGTATLAGSDYTQVNGQTATIMAGSMSTSVTITVNDDDLVEVTESFGVNLTNARFNGATDSSRVTIGDGAGLGTITDNDTATFTINDQTVDEAAGTITFTVSLDNAVDTTVAVDVNYAGGTATGSGTDYDSTADQVTFAPGDSANKTVTVAVSDDNLVELAETFTASLSTATSVGTRTLDLTDTGTGTITDNDTATFTIDDVIVNEGDGTATFTVTSSNPIDIPVDITVSYAGVTATGISGGGAGGDFDNDPDVVRLSANTTSTTATVSITDDAIVEDDESFRASLSTTTMIGTRTLDLNDTATATIADNDAIRVSVAVDPTTVAEDSGSDLVYTFTADTAPASDVTVSFDVTGSATFSADYTVTGAASFGAAAGTVVIMSGTTFTEVRVTPVDDLITEGTVLLPDETVVLTVVNGVDYNLDLVLPTLATGNITDDEAVATPAVVNLNDGVDDNVELIIDAGSYVVRSTSGPMMEFFRRAITSVTHITINGGNNDNDTFSINYVAGDPVPPVNPLITPSGGITINGGAAGNDTVTLDNVGSSFTTHTYDYANANDGTITLNNGSADSTINFTGLEPIVNDGTATDIIFNLPTSADDASLEDSGTSSDGMMSLVSNNGTFEATTFVVPTSSLTINAGDGNDTVTINSADDALVPNDSSNMNSQSVVINGDGGDDILVGSMFNDVMNGGAGNDVLNGRAGNDTLGGDADNDSLLGGSGDDNLFGGDGNDRVIGQGGTDVLGGGAGDDVIDGGAGDSSLREEGNVNLTVRTSGETISLQGLGTDAITGTFTTVTLIGGSSGNQLDARDFLGNVTLDGAGGDDTLFGTSNVDSLIGGAGADRAILQVRGNVVVTDLGVFGPGGDFLSDVEQVQIEIDDPTGAKVDASNYTLGPVTVVGGAGRDTIIGTSRNDFLNGRAGRDQIFGGDGNDRLLGGGSNDLLVGGNGKDTLLGNSGVDTLSGGEGNDRLVGGNNRTVLREEGFAGDVTVTSNGQAAELTGLGNDVLKGSFKTLQLTGDDGPNRIDASGFNFAITLQGGGGDDTLLGGSQGDSLDGGDGVDQIQQTVDLEQILTDTLVTGRGADTLSSIEEAVLIGGVQGTNINSEGFSGNATLIGNGGNDTLIAGSGNDLLDGGDGDDRIFGQGGNDTADGAAGNDSLVGGDGDDILLGGAADDTLLGNGGNDTLLGEAGVDSVDGGSGTNDVTGGGNSEAVDASDSVSVGDAGTIDDALAFDFDSLIASI